MYLVPHKGSIQKYSKGRKKRNRQSMDIKARHRMPVPLGDAGIGWYGGGWGVVFTNSVHPRESPVQAPAVGPLPSSGKHCPTLPTLCEEGGSRSSMQSSESYEYQLNSLLGISFNEKAQLYFSMKGIHRAWTVSSWGIT